MTRQERVQAFVVRSREAIGLAAIVGGVTGLVVALFDRVTVDGALAHVMDLPAWARPWVPMVGLVLAGVVLRIGGRLSPSTSDEYIKDFHTTEDMSLRPFPWRMVAAVLTLGAGVPGGLECPSIYTGSVIGSAFQRRFRRFLGPTKEKNLLVAGAAAGVAAIFRAPATGAVFALEVPYRDDLGRRLLTPSLVGAATGYLAYVAINGTKPLFSIHDSPPFDLKDLLGAVALGAGTGVVIRGYAWLLTRAKTFQRDRPAWLSVALAGLTIGVVGEVAHAAFGADLALTPGYNVLEWVSTPSHAISLVALLLAVRVAGTVAAVGGGGVIGLFVPLVVAGAVFGRLVGEVIGVAHGDLFVVVGVAAALGAGYRVPLAAVTFVAEATGRPGYIVPGLLAAVCADLIMGSASVTTYQQSGSTVHEYH